MGHFFGFKEYILMARAISLYEIKPVSPYPKVAIYKGSGNTNDAANFRCGDPTWYD
jgi:hypothetical protein